MSDPGSAPPRTTIRSGGIHTQHVIPLKTKGFQRPPAFGGSRAKPWPCLPEGCGPGLGHESSPRDAGFSRRIQGELGRMTALGAHGRPGWGGVRVRGGRTGTCPRRGRSASASRDGRGGDGIGAGRGGPRRSPGLRWGRWCRRGASPGAGGPGGGTGSGARRSRPRGRRAGPAAGASTRPESGRARSTAPGGAGRRLGPERRVDVASLGIPAQATPVDKKFFFNFGEMLV